MNCAGYNQTETEIVFSYNNSKQLLLKIILCIILDIICTH